MAKPRRTRRPRAAARKPPSGPAKKAPRAKPTASPAPKPAPPAAPSPSVLARRLSYTEAVGFYERGLELLQRREFHRASDAFRTVLERYPDERELHERVRLYLKVCEREMVPPPPPPQTLEERTYAATLALNAGAHDEALGHLRGALDLDPNHDHIHYMLAVAYTLRRDVERALTHLRRALELNPENRALALHEPDFESIRHGDGFRLILNSVAPPPTARRRPRGRASR